MALTAQSPRDFHWLVDMLESVDIGLVVLDCEYRIELWNGFMENHSGLSSTHVRDQNLFSLFPELPEQWLRRKVDTVVTLNTRTFTSWEQRPWLFRFRSTRPITGTHDYMFQNLTIHPLADPDGHIRRVCLMVYDVTDVATSKLALEQANKQLSRLSRTDRLTGLLNRGSWESLLHTEFARYRRYRQPCTLVMLDIDHFKRINDSHGHPAGDDVIRHAAALIQGCLRDADVAGRYGGEEFGLILPQTDLEGAGVISERLRRAIADARVDTHGQLLRYTISMGMASLTPATATAQEWLERADRALYQAKREGRNRVCALDD
ncbi:diguanylate cyclase [Oceanimonas pelagia]|uniref:diguanylate cyclase n=1 Tax=Oceanimonas pelagia TaxID=3028314 RepID=A0AA50KL89_9GAMM|nr:sensor domain-containing diguanylate cyclase [Oceanimonas pelagia]WMC09614.1 diguanylate cyclase [Oceanimonas pelagia]